MTDDRRLARMMIGTGFLSVLMTDGGHCYWVECGLPGDATIVAAALCGHYVELILRSASFAPVPEGESPPLALAPIFHDLRDRTDDR